MSRSNVLVVGGGLIGLATAYECARRGLRTILVEAEDAVARGASHANGALLAPSLSAPWNAPGVLRQLLASLVDPHAAMKLRLRALPSMTGWGMRFLANATVDRHRAATRASFVLSRYSLDRTRNLRLALGLRSAASARGAIKLFRRRSAVSGPLALAEGLADLGLRCERLDAAQVVDAEPALAPIRDRIACALLFPDDESGDAHAFCLELRDAFAGIGGTLVLGRPARVLRIAGGRVAGVAIDGADLMADSVIVAAGHRSNDLLGQAGAKLPLCPAKGYTLTFPRIGTKGPERPVIDDALHAAVVPVGDRLRVAGTAEFAGDDSSLAAARIENLRMLLRGIYPELAATLGPGEAWTGLRPMSHDGLPFIGATRMPGLYANTGHGHLGWTMAVGSAHLAADAIMGSQSSIDAAPYRPQRLGA